MNKIFILFCLLNNVKAYTLRKNVIDVSMFNEQKLLEINGNRIIQVLALRNFIEQTDNYQTLDEFKRNPSNDSIVEVYYPDETREDTLGYNIFHNNLIPDIKKITKNKLLCAGLIVYHDSIGAPLHRHTPVYNLLLYGKKKWTIEGETFIQFPGDVVDIGNQEKHKTVSIGNTTAVFFVDETQYDIGRLGGKLNACVYRKGLLDDKTYLD